MLLYNNNIDSLHDNIAVVLRTYFCYAGVASGIIKQERSIHPLAFEIPPPKYTAEYILKLLLNPNIDHSRICCTWPVSEIVCSATFVVNLTSFKHPDDV